MPTYEAAIEDQALAATVVSATPLRYAAGADAALDRPAFVRAASALLGSAAGMLVVQDDANFVALIGQGRAGHALALPLPAGAGGLRQFDDLRGNKARKLDLEAGALGPDERGAELLLAFGSGSTALRERVAMAEGLAGAPVVTLVEAPELYAALRGLRAFAGSELNVEGAAYTGGRLLLANRGNGAPAGGVLPANAICALPWAELLRYLRGAGPAPAPELVARYDLGGIPLRGRFANGELPLSFTDIAAARGALLYSAAAEASPDAVRDGPVAGSAVGVIAGGRARYTVLRAPGGGLFTGKVEGLLPDETDPSRLLVVVDRDDPRVPSELCEVELRGPWLEEAT